MQCPKCDSNNTQVNGYLTGEHFYGRKYRCRQCGCVFGTVEMYAEHAQQLLHGKKFDWEAGYENSD